MRPGGPRKSPTFHDIAMALAGLVVLAAFCIAAMWLLRDAVGGILALLGVFGYLAWLDWPNIKSRRRLKRGACPTCGYDMRGLTPTPDGPAPCPECGHAPARTAPPGNI